jgi:hypothetical protein
MGAEFATGMDATGMGGKNRQKEQQGYLRQQEGEKSRGQKTSKRV